MYKQTDVKAERLPKRVQELLQVKDQLVAVTLDDDRNILVVDPVLGVGLQVSPCQYDGSPFGWAYKARLVQASAVEGNILVSGIDKDKPSLGNHFEDIWVFDLVGFVSTLLLGCSLLET